MIGPHPGPQDYPWKDACGTCAHAYLLPQLESVLQQRGPWAEGTRVLDLGCGSGAVTCWLAECGFHAVGVDPSAEGIHWARAAHPELEFHHASAYDPLRQQVGTFPLVVSLEVIEHVYDPLRFVSTVFDVLSPGGIVVISTPYHGWLKNVTIALLGRFDDHVNPLRVHGHIKFWSRSTLTCLLERGA